MTEDSPVLIDVPMPIPTPRLMIRPRKPGDGEFALAAIRETWDELHRWMWWAENLDQFTSGRPTHCPAGSWPTDSAMRGLVQRVCPLWTCIGARSNQCARRAFPVLEINLHVSSSACRNGSAVPHPIFLPNHRV